MGPQPDKHLPLCPFKGQFLRKADIQDWSLLGIWSMHFTNTSYHPLLHMNFFNDGDPEAYLSDALHLRSVNRLTQAAQQFIWPLGDIGISIHQTLPTSTAQQTYNLTARLHFIFTTELMQYLIKICFAISGP